jgi:hypothetical protein
MGGIISDVLDVGAELIGDIPVVGDIADDVLGIDPNGGGIMPVLNVVAPFVIGDYVGGLLSAGSTAGALAGSDAAFIAADAAQLAAQGLGEAQIAQVLAAADVSSGAAALAASMATNGLDATTMTQQLGNLSSNTGLFNQNISETAFNTADAAQLAQQTGNNIASIEQNLVAAGLDPLEAATYAQQAALASGVAPTQGMWDEFTNYLKENPSLLNTLGGAATIGAVSQIPRPTAASVPAFKPVDTMASYSPEYYQQVQQYYNTYMPASPRDVSTPLQGWYGSEYTGPDSVTAKLFSGG